MIRLFVAIPLPEPVRTQLTMLQSGLQGARWLKPENIHLTLRFIGEVRKDVASDIDMALSEIAAPAFELALEGVNSFSRGKHPHALWVGLAKSDPLMHLQAKIESTLVRAGLEAEDTIGRDVFAQGLGFTPGQTTVSGYSVVGPPDQHQRAIL